MTRDPNSNDLDPNDLPALLAAWVAATELPIAVAVARGDFPLVYLNAACEQVTGYPAAVALGRPARFLHGSHTSDVIAETLGTTLHAGRPAHARLQNSRPDGSTWWNDLHLTPVLDPAGAVTHVVGIMRDVTAQVAAEDRVTHAATHDPLTGLANRAHFAEQLDRELARARRTDRSLAVLFLDLDDFKSVNDAYGHAAGDALLVEVAHRLRARLRGEDLAARYGGDEFLALLVDLPEDGTSAATYVARDLAHALSGALPTHRVGVSIGLSLFPRDADTGHGLIAHADAAMYRAKPYRGSPAPSP